MNEIIMHQCIQKIATGPEYSKNLSFEEARDSMRLILDKKVDPVQAAIYFIALRMKREVDDENRGILQACIDTATINTANVAEVVDISDPYNGYVRGIPASPFVAPLLAAMGVNAVSHGLNEVGPKYGATHHKILKSMGLNVQLSPADATEQLESIGWTYIDQAQFAPKLHDIFSLRELMIKRQVLSTIEVLIGPIRGKQKTHFMSGYVHKAYPAVYASLARHAGFDSAMFVRGMEGGIIPSLQQTGRLFSYHDKGEEQQVDLSPTDLQIEQKLRAVPLPENLPAAGKRKGVARMVNTEALVDATAEMGLTTLKGKKGLMYDSLVYSAAICLNHLKRYSSMTQAADAVRKTLDSGKALDKFQSAK